MAAEAPGAGDSQRQLYDAIRDASRYAFYSFLVGLVGGLITMALALALFGLAALTAIAGGPGGFQGGELAAIGVTTIIMIVLVFIVFVVAELYLMMRAGGVLKEYVESAGDRVAAELDLPAKVIYYSAIVGLVGVVTLIIIVGALLLLIALLGIIVGTLLLGVQVRGIHERLSTPGILVAVGAGLQLLGLVIGLLMLVGVIVSLVGFYKLYREAAELAEEAATEGQPTTPPP